jgi:hypothetical protein
MSIDDIIARMIDAYDDDEHECMRASDAFNEFEEKVSACLTLSNVEVLNSHPSNSNDHMFRGLMFACSHCDR